MKSRDNLDCALIGPQYSWNAALGCHKKPCALSVAINLNLVVVLSLQTGTEKIHEERERVHLRFGVMG